MGRIGAEQRTVLPPRLGRLLVEPMADEDKQLGRLADHLVDEVRQRDDRKQDRHGANDPNHRPCSRDWPPFSCVARAKRYPRPFLQIPDIIESGNRALRGKPVDRTKVRPRLPVKCARGYPRGVERV